MAIGQCMTDIMRDTRTFVLMLIGSDFSFANTSSIDIRYVRYALMLKHIDLVNGKCK